MKQGEVRWYTFKAPDKRRPVLILTRNSAIGFLNALTVAPITRTVRDIPSEPGPVLAGAAASEDEKAPTRTAQK